MVFSRIRRINVEFISLSLSRARRILIFLLMDRAVRKKNKKEKKEERKGTALRRAAKSRRPSRRARAFTASSFRFFLLHLRKRARQMLALRR